MDKQTYQEALKVKLYFDLKDCRKENGISLEDELSVICESHDLAEIGALINGLSRYIQKSVQPEEMPEILNPTY